MVTNFGTTPSSVQSLLFHLHIFPSTSLPSLPPPPHPSWSTTTWGQWPGKSVPLLVLIVELQMCFFLCCNSTFIFPGKIEPVADQRSENESYREQIYTLTMWFSTTNELCNQYLLQNDKLKQHRCIFPVKHSAQSASGHGCGLVSKCMHVFISPRCNSYISLLEYAAYVFFPPPPPSYIIITRWRALGEAGCRWDTKAIR